MPKPSCSSTPSLLPVWSLKWHWHLSNDPMRQHELTQAFKRHSSAEVAVRYSSKVGKSTSVISPSHWTIAVGIFLIIVYVCTITFQLPLTINIIIAPWIMFFFWKKLLKHAEDCWKNAVGKPKNIINQNHRTTVGIVPLRSWSFVSSTMKVWMQHNSRFSAAHFFAQFDSPRPRVLLCVCAPVE